MRSLHARRVTPVPTKIAKLHAMKSNRPVSAVLAMAGALLMLGTSACHNAQKLPEGYAQGDYFGQVHTRGTAPGTPPRGVNMAGVRDTAPEFTGQADGSSGDG